MSAFPHPPQNLTPGEFAAPQDGHASASALPHSPQNFRPTSFADPQEAHVNVSTAAHSMCRVAGAQSHPATLRSVALETAGARGALSPDRAWWLRVPAILLSPRPVLFALREDDPDDVAARSEPLLLIVWMAGAAAVLATPTAGALLDKPEYDAALVAVWAFVAGGIYGVVGYLLFGFALFFGTRLLGSLGDFRRERQLVGFALTPLALSLLVLFPVRLALYGGDTFRDGGPDEGTGETVLLVSQLAFVAWSLTLLVVGVRVVHGWGWFRSLAALAAGVALLAAIVGVFAML